MVRLTTACKRERERGLVQAVCICQRLRLYVPIISCVSALRCGATTGTCNFNNRYLLAVMKEPTPKYTSSSSNVVAKKILQQQQQQQQQPSPKSSGIHETPHTIRGAVSSLL